jgi:hypothetical protein
VRLDQQREARGRQAVQNGGRVDQPGLGRRDAVRRQHLRGARLVADGGDRLGRREDRDAGPLGAPQHGQRRTVAGAGDDDVARAQVAPRVERVRGRAERLHHPLGHERAGGHSARAQLVDEQSRHPLGEVALVGQDVHLRGVLGHRVPPEAGEVLGTGDDVRRL